MCQSVARIVNLCRRNTPSAVALHKLQGTNGAARFTPSSGQFFRKDRIAKSLFGSVRWLHGARRSVRRWLMALSTIVAMPECWGHVLPSGHVECSSRHPYHTHASRPPLGASLRWIGGDIFVVMSVIDFDCFFFASYGFARWSCKLWTEMLIKRFFFRGKLPNWCISIEFKYRALHRGTTSTFILLAKPQTSVNVACEEGPLWEHSEAGTPDTPQLMKRVDTFNEESILC